MLSTVLLVAAAVSQATAATIRVDVGKGLVFTPNNIKAAVGDHLEFHFLGGVHDVARGDFSKACEPAATDGFYSGVIRPQGGEAPDVFRVTVTNTDPIFFYCSVEGHCSGGMVGVVNPSSSQTLQAYQDAAGSAVEVAPAEVFGGLWGPAGSFSDTDSAPGSVSSSPSGASTGSPAGAPTGSPADSAKPNSSSPVSVNGATGPSAQGAKAVLAGIIGVAALAMF